MTNVACESPPQSRLLSQDSTRQEVDILLKHLRRRNHELRSREIFRKLGPSMLTQKFGTTTSSQAVKLADLKTGSEQKESLRPPGNVRPRLQTPQPKELCRSSPARRS
ncbi:hypothetical protein DY000_02033165 [Brassica cretica]|uniref:Uncharacterized protein n=1 Tax=Brassica cretica TaxID=69181 RepID=A0ABQ7DVW3_BRACR|nr:hypothetical protein DY000_02033165 [Brassica cretica]